MLAILLVIHEGLVLPTAGRVPTTTTARAAAVRMDFFGDIMKGMTKLQAGSYDEAAVKAALERQIASRPCIMYSTSTCPFCKQVKELMSKLGTMYTLVELDEVCSPIPPALTPNRLLTPLARWPA